ncbi:Signal transducer regulating beta-lactamase production, contains metallopeptidase domain [Flavobacteriaceae bacterium MAR_2010_188]|nr:Signal transducer regulating beta-lactamase production, contains metallopeptidase domain [Flavobacteriaceae bacterium MAR_2010_188]
MIPFILKFSACLALFMLLYKLLFEETSAHSFKRFYLLFAVLVSLSIPIITFTEYIEVPAPTMSFVEEVPQANHEFVAAEKTFQDYLPAILWSIYLLGVAVFTARFLKNLSDIIKKIKQNPRVKDTPFINVLLSDLLAPHTFFNFIFLNRDKYYLNAIPEEVFIHEQTHAKQKHSADILFLEILQIIFWFNPLIYLLRKDIKLNHEFLADRAVLEQGIEHLSYQQLLLEFSSHSNSPEMANAINYSSIKKRFTVMKTKTSKNAFLLRTLMILPLLAFTVYGFSEKKTETIYSNKLNQTEQATTNLENAASKYETPILVLEKNSLKLKLNGQRTSFASLKNDFIKLIDSKKSNLSLSTNDGVKLSLIYQIRDVITTEYLESIILSENGYIINDVHAVTLGDTIIHLTSANDDQIKEYNRLAKKYNEMESDHMMVKKSELERIEYIYNLMTDAQKAKAELYPEVRLPPPPPTAPNPSKSLSGETIIYEDSNIQITTDPLEFNGEEIIAEESPNQNQEYQTGFKIIAGKPHFYVTVNDNTKYYNRKGFEVNSNGVVVSKSQVNSSDVVPGQNISKVYQDDKVVAEFKNNRPGYGDNLRIPTPPPPPPKPKDPIDHLVEMAKKDADFYLEGKSVSSDQAIDALKNNRKLNIETKNSNSAKPKVYITTAPIGSKPLPQDKPILVNGKKPQDYMIVMTQDELLKLNLEIEGSEITSYKLKIPGVKTLMINSNSLDESSKIEVAKAQKGDNLQLFDIKTADGKKNAPIMIQVKE